jgi:hypothetical protein
MKNYPPRSGVNSVNSRYERSKVPGLLVEKILSFI